MFFKHDSQYLSTFFDTLSPSESQNTDVRYIFQYNIQLYANIK